MKKIVAILGIVVLLVSCGKKEETKEKVVDLFPSENVYPIPSSAGDKGRYFLIDKRESGKGKFITIHKRIGVNEIAYTKMEINCKTGQYLELGYGEETVGNIKEYATKGKWAEIVEGSIKWYVVSFVCQ